MRVVDEAAVMPCAELGLVSLRALLEPLGLRIAEVADDHARRDGNRAGGIGGGRSGCCERAEAGIGGAGGTARSRAGGTAGDATRSEEHTSELQSLMRNSYA